MTTENYQIDRYQYEIRMDADKHSGRQKDLLYLYGTGDKLVCVVAFVDDKQEVSAPRQMEEGYVAAQLRLSSLNSVIDMLRNEKPIYVSWSSGDERLRIATGPEPVGEQELRKLFSFLYI